MLAWKRKNEIYKTKENIRNGEYEVLIFSKIQEKTSYYEKIFVRYKGVL